ncbi:tol-pal system protein YbgF [Citreimonas salinaria]|uniref:Cell division coordinator CpoB n=1 Tax=Citreimonas salinaria TaxID=321339 RepID=A0A1H3J8Z5_9RHOB|nr:tol-pal system protein YbgF [Citreimonas salinaria]SDY36386.1 tol-pal system protein YbgF [Citreimonas salinaria]
MRGLILAAGLALAALPGAAQQAETLADIKQDMSVLYVELQRLKQELNTTGVSDMQLPASALDRIAAIEEELGRITAKAEELEFRIAQVVENGTNRLGDLDFRLCELEPGCDIGSLGETPRLGGDAVPPAPAPQGVPAVATDSLPQGAGELAVSEEADFVAAQQAIDAGDYAGAAQLFAQFRETYPQGPLEAAALVGEGRALDGAGDTREAARRFLRAYSDYPDSPVAPEALWRLGEALGDLGSAAEACVTLDEVSARYPASDYAARARESRAALACQ